jgi:hypothetical protein
MIDSVKMQADSSGMGVGKELPPPSKQDPRSSVVMLKEAIEKKTATVGVIGLGYVGLPLIRYLLIASRSWLVELRMMLL